MLGRIEERVCNLGITLAACEEQIADEGLCCTAGDELYNIGGYAERILSYIRASDDKNMMLECCKVDRSIIHHLMVLIENKHVLSSLLKCVECLFKIHNIALEKIWGIDVEDIENSKYCIDIYGKCYLMNDDEKVVRFIPKPDTIQQLNNQSMDFPIELRTDKAEVILKKAIDGGLMDNTYKWSKSKALLAYFADKTSEYLGLCKGEYDGKPKVSWQPFETLFCIKGLSGAKRDYQKTGTLPSGHDAVDKLFK